MRGCSPSLSGLADYRPRGTSVSGTRRSPASRAECSVHFDQCFRRGASYSSWEVLAAECGLTLRGTRRVRVLSISGQYTRVIQA